MARQKKDWVPYSLKLDRIIYEQLKQYSEETGLTQTKALEMMLQKYLSAYFDRPEEERKAF